MLHMRLSRHGDGSYDKLLDDMMIRTLEGEIIPFDEFLDALDELSEEVEYTPTEADIAEASKARSQFIEQVESFGLPLEQPFRLCRELCRLAETSPSLKLLRLLCYIVCDTGTLLDLDRSDHSPEQDAVTWREIHRDAEEMYAALSERKRQITRFRESIAGIGKVSLKNGSGAPENDALQAQIYEAYAKIYHLQEENPILRDNILWLLQIADSVPALAHLKPLFLYRVLLRHRKRMETEREIHLDFRALWKRKEYNIDSDNGKNFRSYARALKLFEMLYQILGAEETVDTPLCMAGFDCLSNLGEYYRNYPENMQILPLGPSVESLFVEVVFSCFEHGYGDNLIMEANHISATKLDRFLCGNFGNSGKALDKVSDFIRKDEDKWRERFLEAYAIPDSGCREEQAVSLCKTIMAGVKLPASQQPASDQETNIFLAAIFGVLMEIVDEQAETYLKTAARLLCGEMRAEKQK